MSSEVFYIKYLNQNKNYQSDIKEFSGINAYNDAKLWGKKNLSNFNSDLIYSKTKD